VLVSDERTRLFDSRVIVEYLDSISPVNRLIPETSRQRIQVRRWEALADGILDAAVLLVQEGRRPAALQYPPVIERQRAKVERGLAMASEELADKPWCNAEGYSLGDIALGCMLGFLDFRFPDIAWRDTYPNLARHAEKLFRLEPFVLTAPRD
jgi:glutathione S-transferase